MYEVLKDRYVGKHGVYKKGKKIPAEEIMGGDEGKKLALEGQKDAKNARGQKLANVAPALKVAKKEAKK